MADRPIIFSAPMVRALLDGRKTQTRRVFIPPAPFDANDDITVELATGSIAPKWQRGDRLWVRETAAVRYTSWHHVDGHKHSVTYAADEDGHGCHIGKTGCGSQIRNGKAPSHFPSRTFNKDGRLRWASPIHMPRWASRLTLAVTDVRVERLQDISEEDARAEGAMLHVPCKSAVGGTCLPSDSWYFDQSLDGRLYEDTTARGAFEILWGKINGWKSWNENPWVAAISFEVRHANIDALLTSEAAA